MIVLQHDVLQSQTLKFLYVIKFERDRLHYHYFHDGNTNKDYFVHDQRWVVV